MKRMVMLSSWAAVIVLVGMLQQIPASSIEPVLEGRGWNHRRGRVARLINKDQSRGQSIALPSTQDEGKLPVAPTGLSKPTKYHYYPHNQHIYLLPECAVQQVCNAVYVRLNTTQPLCACPNRYRDPCSASLSSDDLHTTELVMESKIKALTLVKTCEPVTEMRECRAPRDWSLLALQNIRTGKSHYLVVCRCPHSSVLEGPIVHDQPTYASVPGIRVYGMVCVPKRSRRSLILGRKTRPVSSYTRLLMEDILREQV